ELAWGTPLEPVYHLDRAGVILTLDADLFLTSPGRVRYARDFATGRGVQRPDDRPYNRLYAVESTPTITGAAADHRLPLRAGQVESFARTLAGALGLDVEPGQALDDTTIPANWIDAVARDLQANSGAGLVIVGDHQPPVVHALAHAINQTLGNAGQTVTYRAPVVANPANQTQSLRDLVTAMNAGEVELLLILDGNPVYNAPADLEFAAAL